MRSLGTERVSKKPEGIDDEENNRDFQVMRTAKKVAKSSIRGGLRMVHGFGEDGDSTLPTTAKVIELVRVGFESKCRNATSSDLNMDMKAKLFEARAVKDTMGEYLARAERRIISLKTQLGDAQLVLG